MKKLANCVLPPLAAKTELRENEAVKGIHPKNEQNIEPTPKAIISWVASVFFPPAEPEKIQVNCQKGVHDKIMLDLY